MSHALLLYQQRKLDSAREMLAHLPTSFQKLCALPALLDAETDVEDARALVEESVNKASTDKEYRDDVLLRALMYLREPGRAATLARGWTSQIGQERSDSKQLWPSWQKMKIRYVAGDIDEDALLEAAGESRLLRLSLIHI